MKPRNFHAFHLAERLKLTSLLSLFPDRPFRASGTELAYRYGKDHYLIIYHFGSVVFFDIDPLKEQQFLTMLRQFISRKEDITSSEEFTLEDGKTTKVEFRKVILDEVTYEKLQTISVVLAQSTALDYYENIVGAVLEKSTTFSESLESTGKIGKRMVELLKFIGFCLNTKQKVISSTYLLDDPDPTWEDATLESLHRQMSDMFEIKDRFRTLEYKLKTVQETLEILSDLSQSQRFLYLEIAIVALIAIELFLMFFK